MWSILIRARSGRPQLSSARVSHLYHCTFALFRTTKVVNRAWSYQCREVQIPLDRMPSRNTNRKFTFLTHLCVIECRAIREPKSVRMKARARFGPRFSGKRQGQNSRQAHDYNPNCEQRLGKRRETFRKPLGMPDTHLSRLQMCTLFVQEPDIRNLENLKLHRSKHQPRGEGSVLRRRAIRSRTDCPKVRWGGVNTVNTVCVQAISNRLQGVWGQLFMRRFCEVWFRSVILTTSCV